VARTSREGDRVEHAAANSELDHPPERGVPCSAPQPGRQAPHQPRCGNPSQTQPQEPLTVSTTSLKLVDPPINDLSRVSLAAMARPNSLAVSLFHGRN
jgi:hypothetical protein